MFTCRFCCDQQGPLHAQERGSQLTLYVLESSACKYYLKWERWMDSHSKASYQSWRVYATAFTFGCPHPGKEQRQPWIQQDLGFCKVSRMKRKYMLVEGLRTQYQATNHQLLRFLVDLLITSWIYETWSYRSSIRHHKDPQTGMRP